MANVDMKKVGKKAAGIVILGVSGLIVLGIVNLYRFNRGLDLLSLDGENWWK